MEFVDQGIQNLETHRHTVLLLWTRP